MKFHTIQDRVPLWPEKVHAWMDSLGPGDGAQPLSVSTVYDPNDCAIVVVGVFVVLKASALVPPNGGRLAL